MGDQNSATFVILSEAKDLDRSDAGDASLC
jgi:hypothetical protein